MITSHAVQQAVLVVDATRPKTREFVLQRLRLAYVFAQKGNYWYFGTTAQIDADAATA